MHATISPKMAKNFLALLPIGIFYVVLPLSGVLNIIYTILNIVDIATDSAVAGEEA